MAGASRQATAVNVGRKGAHNPLQQSCAPTACRSTFCSLSVVSHSQFRELALFPSVSHSLSLDRLLTHFVMLLPSTSSLSSSPHFSFAVLFPVSETFTYSEWAVLKPGALMNPPSQHCISLSPFCCSLCLYLSLFHLLIPKTNCTIYASVDVAVREQVSFFYVVKCHLSNGTPIQNGGL